MRKRRKQRERKEIGNLRFAISKGKDTRQEKATTDYD
jgi:hypothetical protein